jgi:hypothetical protein
MKREDLQAFIRSNGYAWPGGYPCALQMADGECIDAQSARENYRQIRRNMTTCPYNRDWSPVGVFIHWEGEPIECAHSGRLIESVYGVPELEGAQ